MKPALLIIDDDEDIRTQLKWALCDDYDIVLAEDRASALEQLRAKRPAVVLLDLGLPPHPATPEEGFAILAQLLAYESRVKVIILSGQGERANSLRAVGEGAYDFLCKPPDLDELKVILKRAFHVADLQREYQVNQQSPQADCFEGMIGGSAPMKTVFDSIRKVAGSEAPVLLLGESGTGKEMVAQAIHRLSSRKKEPFVAINCAAIPETLIESELFGHEKGSFTGAHAQRQGRIEMAAGGTLLLDEFGELPMSIQVKLLRFLQEQTIERVGGRVEIRVNTRLVTATNLDLKQAIATGKFREDLYYRVAVVTMKLPPLRERLGDILLISREFLHKYAEENGRSSLKFRQDAIRAMEQHEWPGNVRELENRIRRAVIMSDGSTVKAEDLELKDNSVEAPARRLKEAREEVDRQMVQEALRKHGSNITSAAGELGISRPTLYELMDKLGMARPQKE